MNKNNRESFESQLSESAKRIRETQDKGLRVKAEADVMTKVSTVRRQYTGWIATPVAAVIGLLVGLFIQRPAEQTENYVVPIVAETEVQGYNIIEDGADYSMIVSL